MQPGGALHPSAIFFAEQFPLPVQRCRYCQKHESDVQPFRPTEFSGLVFATP